MRIQCKSSHLPNGAEAATVLSLAHVYNIKYVLLDPQLHPEFEVDPEQFEVLLSTNHWC